VANAVAAGIVDYICRSDVQPGQRLTEQGLADALGVSRSPVRKALQYLETLGAVGSTPNRGFTLALPAAQLRRLSLPADQDSDDANYLTMADDRLSGDLPDEITESELMARYDLTRLQVQRILNRMAREGLVDRKPGRGWVFRPVLSSAKSWQEGYRFRMIIEPAALLEPTFRVDKAAFERARREQLAMLDGGIRKWPRSELFRVGAEFHETLVACANNAYLLEALRNLNQQRRLLEYRANVDRSRFATQCEEHLALLDLIEAGDRMEAAHRLRQHLDVVRAVKLQEPAPPGRTKADTIEVHF
jgi:DNA-binding GntR family transcriptional regulator